MGRSQILVGGLLVIASMASVAVRAGEEVTQNERCTCVVLTPVRHPVAVSSTESFSAGIPSVMSSLYSVPSGGQFILERVSAIARGAGAENPRNLEVVLSRAAGFTRIPVGTFPPQTGATDSPFVSQTIGVTVAAGTEIAVLEATSEGLAQHRVSACDFDVAVVTNVTHEHLYYHGSLKAYQQAKAMLFHHLLSGHRKLGIP